MGKNSKNLSWIWIIVILAIAYLFVDETLKENPDEILLEGTNGKTIVFISGITGTPKPYTDIATYFNEKGYTVYVPKLKNHGTKLSLVANTPIEEIKQDLKDKINGNDITLVATCSGALLALDIADEENYNAILINPPLESFSFWKYIPLPYTYRFDIGLLKDSSQLSKVSRYNKYSINLLTDLNEYEKTMPLETDIPLLVIQSDNDIRAKGYELLINAEVINLHNSGHLAYLDVEKQRVYDAIEYFIEVN